jgi:hypothetical protein
MLRWLGSSRRLCDGLSRRDLLRAGCLTGLAAALPAAAEETLPQFGRAKRVLFLYLYGAAAQHETFDPKPLAPAEIRGEFSPIATAVPGLSICEHLPKLARLMDRVSVIRSMTHPYNIHSAAFTMTGVDTVDVLMELRPYDNRHWPFFGGVVDHLQQRRHSGAPREIPANLALPFPFSSHAPNFQRAGPYGGFLGQAFNPVWMEFEGQATRTVNRWVGNRDVPMADPYCGITPESRFTVSKAAQLLPEITLDRLDHRRSLLEQLDDGRRQLEGSVSGGGLSRFQSMAYSLLTSQRLRNALDVQQEPAAIREQYGMTLFGQAVLAGRRLLEAGAQVVTVIWDEYGPANTAWDTHFDHYQRLREELLPGLDSALSAVLLDLEQRGMLDDTLVLCLTEHGRTPQLTLKARGVGREHWSETYCNLLAGAGIARGKVIGSSDAHGAFVKDDPVSPKDVLCTMYHLLGFNPHQLIRDSLGRPLPLVAEGKILSQALA